MTAPDPRAPVSATLSAAHTAHSAARIIFSLVASAAASERIFALVKTMFGEEQLSSLADLVQAALMLRKNERAVG